MEIGIYPGSSAPPDYVEEMRGKHDEPRGFLWGEVNVTMPRRVLCMADRTGKQRHIRLPLGGDSVYVGQRAALRMKGSPHQSDANKIVRIARLFSVCRLSNRNLDFLEGLENSHIVVAPRISGWTGNTALMVEAEFFGRDRPRAGFRDRHGRGGREIRGLTVEEYIHRLGQDLIPLAERCARVMREALAALEATCGAPSQAVERSRPARISLMFEPRLAWII